MQTWAEVNSGVDALEGSTLEITHACSISGEQDHLISQIRAEQLAEMPHVIKITGKVTAVFILYLWKKAITLIHVRRCVWVWKWNFYTCFTYVQGENTQTNKQYINYLYSNDGSAILVKVTFYDWQQLPHPLIHCCKVI